MTSHSPPYVKTRTYWLETYGCQMNKAESAALERDLQANGFSPAAGPQSADVVLLNTCAVRKTAEDRIWGRLGFYRHLKKERPFTLAVLGCMSERLRKTFPPPLRRLMS